MYTRFILFFACCLLTISGQAQIDLAVGEWKSYLPVNIGRYVTQSENKVYYATQLSLVSIEKETRAIQRLSKIDGLTNVEVSVLAYNQESDILILVYQDGSIDLIKPEGISTLFDIKNFTGITGDKEVYRILVEDGNSVFLATNFGISKLNLENEEFAFTTFTGVAINDLAIYDNSLYAATDEGIYRTSLDNPFPEDFSNWDYLDDSFGLLPDYSCRAIASYGNQLIIDMNDSLHTYDGTANASFLYHEEGFSPTYLSAEGERLLAGLECVDNCGGKVLIYSEDLSVVENANRCVDRPIYGIEDQFGTIWYADEFRDFRIQDLDDTDCDRPNPNSMFSPNIYDIEIFNDELWIASGGVTSNFNYLNRKDGFFSLIDGLWTTHNTTDFGEVWDFLDIEIHPETEVVYAGAYYDGLIVYDRSEYEVVDNSNSSLTNPPVDSARTRISGLAFDQENNLWVSNFGAEDGAISVLRAEDGQWQKFNPPACQEDALAQVAVDFNNYKWFVSQSTSTGMIVLDAGVLNDPSDDRCRVFTEGNSNLPSNQVNCVEVDLDGDVWIGTAAGTVVFECGPSVFEPECTGSLRIVEQDNFGAFLLETENIRTIAIDGANRKWFGTDNGIFVQSSNGEEQIAFYNVENSPLFDNVINDIAIHPTTGEIFIGTNKGLQSIRGEAVEGGTVNSSDVVVFPNPVRPDYEGVIAINGLAQDANVKITDIHGQLVFEGEAFGGQAIWDGRDYNGRRAATGVYLVFSTSQSNFSNPNTAVAKIMFIN